MCLCRAQPPAYAPCTFGCNSPLVQAFRTNTFTFIFLVSFENNYFCVRGEAESAQWRGPESFTFGHCTLLVALQWHHLLGGEAVLSKRCEQVKAGYLHGTCCKDKTFYSCRFTYWSRELARSFS